MKKFLFLLPLMMLCACSTCKTVKQSGIKEIQYGHGGGFTGAVTTYSLHRDGTLFEQDKQVKKLTCEQMSPLFEQAAALPKESFVRPENTYMFVRILTRDGQTYYYAWSLADMPDKQVIDLYTQLKKL